MSQSMIKNMELFYGTREVMATPMTLLEYNIYRGWTLPADLDGTDKGYFVEYVNKNEPNPSGAKTLISWTPAVMFEATYEPIGALSFGHALVALKSGKSVSRIGWHCKEVSIYYVESATPYIAVRTSTEDSIPWTPDQSDILATDWFVTK